MIDMTEKKIETSQLGWNIPKWVKDMYTAWCDRMGGAGYQDEAGGAILLWIHLSAEIREEAKRQSKDPDAYDEEFWKAFASEQSRTLRESRAPSETREGRRRLAGGKR